MKKHYFIGFILILVFPCIQAAELKVGSVTLSPGMEQGDVLEELRSHFHIVKVSGAKSMFFLSEDEADKDRPVASLAFENGQISWIEKNWGTFSGRISPVEVTKALLSAMESANISSGSSAEISTSVRQNHGAEFKSVHFIFPDRKIIVVTTNGDIERGQHVRIYERVDGNDAQHYDDNHHLPSVEPCNQNCPDIDPLQQNSQDGQNKG
jgi:hypothetical protein